PCTRQPSGTAMVKACSLGSVKTIHRTTQLAPGLPCRAGCDGEVAGSALVRAGSAALARPAGGDGGLPPRVLPSSAANISAGAHSTMMLAEPNPVSTISLSPSRPVGPRRSNNATARDGDAAHFVDTRRSGYCCWYWLSRSSSISAAEPRAPSAGAGL